MDDLPSVRSRLNVAFQVPVAFQRIYRRQAIMMQGGTKRKKAHVRLLEFSISSGKQP
jgi:hypothetical protein